MTPQELFDKAYIGVVKQGVPSRSESGGCFYRGPNGSKCAVGFLIDDETAEEWEGFGVWYVLRGAPNLPAWFVENADLLEVMQKAHDDSGLGDFTFVPEKFLPDFKARMHEIAQSYSLTVPEVV